MPRFKSKKRTKAIFKLEKREKYAFLLLGMFVVMTGASVAFSTFGLDSVWGADVQFDSISFMGTLIDEPEELPEYSFNVGSRTITADFDGKTLDTFDWETATDYWGSTGITYSEYGMSPTINYDLSRFKYYSNVTEELDEAQSYLVLDNTDQTIDVHFYFGFSIAFSTAAYSISLPSTGLAPKHVFIAGSDVNYGWRTESIVESREVEMTSVVALRFEALSGDFDYTGTLNQITVIGERAYYVTQPPGTDYATIEEFNADYDWNDKQYTVFGYAEPVGVPKITYGVINSETEKMATIEATAKLRPALDPMVTSVSEIPLGSYDGYVVVSGIDTYNVGFIYDIVVDVSINDIPVYDESAILALGRYGINLPVPPPPLWYLSPMVLIVVLVLSFILARRFL